MKPASGNLYADLPALEREEAVAALLETPGLRIERIVSAGQATPAGQWLDQERDEWVILLRGAAGLRFADEAGVRLLAAGDHVHIPAHCRHRVEWTARGEPTLWLAVHCR